jgi:hypothetical protein
MEQPASTVKQMLKTPNKPTSQVATASTTVAIKGGNVVVAKSSTP